MQGVFTFVVSVLVIVGILGGGFLVLDNSEQKQLISQCENTSIQIGYPTTYFKETGCLVELREGWWVPEEEVINYIQFLDCGEKLQ